MSNIPDDRLFQEDLRTEPFWMLVACVLVNVTRWGQARSVLDGIRARWPTAADLAAADLSEVEQVVRCLGLGRRRAAKLVGLAAAWSRAEPRSRNDVLSLPGCGAYAADSWEMFVLGRQDVIPTDRALLSYRSGAPRARARALLDGKCAKCEFRDYLVALGDPRVADPEWLAARIREEQRRARWFEKWFDAWFEESADGFDFGKEEVRRPVGQPQHPRRTPEERQEAMKAAHAGVAAFADGIAESSCPHKVPTLAYSAWGKGWQEARDRAGP